MERQGCISLSSTNTVIHAKFPGQREWSTPLKWQSFWICRMLADPSGSTKTVSPALIFSPLAQFLNVSNTLPCRSITSTKTLSGYRRHGAHLNSFPTCGPSNKTNINPCIVPFIWLCNRSTLLPPVDSEHAKLMDLVTYNAARTFTIPNPSSSNYPNVWPTAVLDAVDSSTTKPTGVSDAKPVWRTPWNPTLETCTWVFFPHRSQSDPLKTKLDYWVVLILDIYFLFFG